MTWLRWIGRRSSQLVALESEERLFLLRAWLLLPLASVLVRASSLECARSRLRKVERFLAGGRRTRVDVRTGRRLVAWAARLRPRRSRCLAQAMVVEACVPAARMQIGVRRRSEELEAHAWVEELSAAAGEPTPTTDYLPLLTADGLPGMSVID